MVADGPKATKPILIVEDDKSIGEALQDLLESEGYSVTCALNGEKALKLLHSTPTLPRVILLNLMMPVMNGFQFRAEQERNPRFSTIPIVIMTASGHIESKRIRLGAHGFIKKPLDIDDVVKKIEPYFQ